MSADFATKIMLAELVNKGNVSEFGRRINSYKSQVLTWHELEIWIINYSSGHDQTFKTDSKGTSLSRIKKKLEAESKIDPDRQLA